MSEFFHSDIFAVLAIWIFVGAVSLGGYMLHLAFWRRSNKKGPILNVGTESAVPVVIGGGEVVVLNEHPFVERKPILGRIFGQTKRRTTRPVRRSAPHTRARRHARRKLHRIRRARGQNARTGS